MQKLFRVKHSTLIKLCDLDKQEKGNKIPQKGKWEKVSKKRSIENKKNEWKKFKRKMERKNKVR